MYFGGVLSVVAADEPRPIEAMAARMDPHTLGTITALRYYHCIVHIHTHAPPVFSIEPTMGSQTPSAARRDVAGLAAFWDTKAEAPEIKRARTGANLTMMGMIMNNSSSRRATRK